MQRKQQNARSLGRFPNKSGDHLHWIEERHLRGVQQVLFGDA